MKRAHRIDDHVLAFSSTAAAANQVAIDVVHNNTNKRQKLLTQLAHTGVNVVVRQQQTQAPLRFQLLNLHYMPEDNHTVYLEGRSSDPSIGGVCAITTHQMDFYLEPYTPFKNDTEIKAFLDAVQDHISELDRIVINNEYEAELYAGKELTSNLHHGKGTWKETRESSAAENLANFCVSFEHVKMKHKTFAHWTPDSEFLDVVKLSVRLPYMAEALHKYFESNQYLNWIKSQGKDPDWLVRTYLATVDVDLVYSFKNDVRRGRWCTINKYRILPQHQRKVYKKTNLYFETEDLTCDFDDVEPAPLRILSMDLEMPPKRDPQTGECRFPRPLVHRLTQYGKRVKEKEVVESSVVAAATTTTTNNKPKASKTKVSEKTKMKNKTIELYKRMKKASPAEAAVSPDEALLEAMVRVATDTTVVEEEDSASDEKDTDPIVIMAALVFDDVGGVEPKLDYGRILIYKHPMAPSCANIEDWADSAKERLKTALTQAGLPQDVLYDDIMGYWKYGKFTIEEFDSEMDMIYRFQDILHESDIDIITGWNIMSFDLPYIFKRYLYYRYVLGDSTLEPLNFGAIVGGKSDLRLYHGPKRNLFKEGGSAKAQKAYDYITLPHYTINDGLEIWRTDNEEKKHSLNVVSQRFLKYPKSVVASSVCLAKEKTTREAEQALRQRSHSVVEDMSNVAVDEGEEEEEAEECVIPPTTPKSLADLVKNPGCKYLLTKMTEAQLDTVIDMYSLPKSETIFPMKKIEFHHAEGQRYWRTGGHMMLKFALYCAIDCLLPVHILKTKGKIQSQLSFTMVSGVNFEDIYGRGQQMKVNSALYIYSHRLHDNLFLVYDKGWHHFHWPGVFRNPRGYRDAIARNWDRLKPFFGRKANEGGKVQKPFIYGILDAYVATKDAASMYPTIMNSLNLCQTSFLNRFLIQFYNVPRYDYAMRILGPASANMCGERLGDHSAALAMGSGDSDVMKVSYFHQNCKSVVPYIVKDYKVERDKGKAGKAAWLKVFDYCKEKVNSSMGMHSFDALCEAREQELLQLAETNKDDETAPKYFKEKEELEALYDKLMVEHSNSKLLPDVMLFRRYVKLGLLIWRICFGRSALAEFPRDLQQLTSKSSCTLMKLILRNITSLSETERTPIGVMNLSKIQANNYDHYQLGVKVSMNSLYGVLMRVAGALALPEISTTVTSFGRDLIMHVKCTVERQTSENAKQYLGLTGAANKTDAQQEKENKKRVENLWVPGGSVLRKLDNDFVKKLRPVLQSWQCIFAIYG